MAEFFSGGIKGFADAFSAAATSPTTPVAGLAAQFLQAVEIRTTLNPETPIVWHPLARTVDQQGREVVVLPSALNPLSWFQPQITIRGPGGAEITTLSPGGPLTKNYKAYAWAVGAGAVSFTGWLVGSDRVKNWGLVSALALAAVGYLSNRNAGAQ